MAIIFGIKKDGHDLTTQSTLNNLHYFLNTVWSFINLGVRISTKKKTFVIQKKKKQLRCSA